MALPAIADFIGSSVTEAQFKTALADLLDYVENEAGGKPGDFVFTGKSTPPTGTIKANGAAVARSVYANLDAAIYVGDANNPTADYGYRCTDPLNPTTTRSVSGAYIVIPDLRGEFIRGWDDARGVDTGRVLGSAQDDDNKAHTHTTDSQGTHTHTIANNVARVSGNLQITASSGGGYAAPTSTTSSAGAHTHTAQSSGGTEARPRNIALLACIKY